MQLEEKNVIKQEEYNNLFKAMSNLYGIITSDEIYYLLKHYYEDITREEVEEELKNLIDNPVKDYVIRKIPNKKDGKLYLIINVLDEIYIRRIINQRNDKILYVPKTKEDLLKYTNDVYMTSNEEEFYSQMVKFLAKRNKEKDKERNAKFFTLSLFCKNKVDRSTENINMFSKLGQLNIHIKDENDAQKFIKLYMNCANNTKMFANKGWSPNELLKNAPKKDIEDIQDAIRARFKDIIENHNVDASDALERINELDIPDDIKKTLIKELEEMQFNSKNKA